MESHLGAVVKRERTLCRAAFGIPCSFGADTRYWHCRAPSANSGWRGSSCLRLRIVLDPLGEQLGFTTWSVGFLVFPLCHVVLDAFGFHVAIPRCLHGFVWRCQKWYLQTQERLAKTLCFFESKHINEDTPNMDPKNDELLILRTPRRGPKWWEPPTCCYCCAQTLNPKPKPLNPKH